MPKPKSGDKTTKSRLEKTGNPGINQQTKKGSEPQKGSGLEGIKTLSMQGIQLGTLESSLVSLG